MIRGLAARTAVALAAIAMAAPMWLASPAGAAPAALCNTATASALSKAGATRVAVVIDNGGSVDARCIEVNANLNGAQFLAARAQILGTPAPTYNASGLLCSIDGYPNTGCGDRSGGSYAYWSYWDGRTGSWVYSSVGPASRRMTGSSVEGWRFQRSGAGKPTDPPPRFAADRNRICPPPPKTPATQKPKSKPKPAAPAPRPAAPQPAAPRPAAPQPANPQGAAPRTPTPQLPSRSADRAPAPAAGGTANQQAPQPQQTVPTPNQPAQPGQPAPANAGTTGGTGDQPNQQATPGAPQETASDGGAAQKGSSTTKKSKSNDSKKKTTTTKKPARKKPTTTKASKSTTTVKAPKGGPTTLADGDGDLGRVTNVAAAANLVESEPDGASSGWWGLIFGLMAIGGAAASARWLRQRRSA